MTPARCPRLRTPRLGGANRRRMAFFPCDRRDSPRGCQFADSRISAMLRPVRPTGRSVFSGAAATALGARCARRQPHILAQHADHARLVARPALFKKREDVGIDAQGDRLLGLRQYDFGCRPLCRRGNKRIGIARHRTPYLCVLTAFRRREGRNARQAGRSCIRRVPFHAWMPFVLKSTERCRCAA